jgi:hypothetical protein
MAVLFVKRLEGIVHALSCICDVVPVADDGDDTAMRNGLFVAFSLAMINLTL